MEETTTEVDITKVGEEDTMTDMAKEVIKFLVSFLEILIKKNLVNDTCKQGGGLVTRETEFPKT